MGNLGHSSVGKRLKRFREAAGFSKAALARATGLSCKSIHNHEHGVTLPSASAAFKYERALNVPMKVLFGNDLTGQYRKSAFRAYSNGNGSSGVLEGFEYIELDRKLVGLSQKGLSQKSFELVPSMMMTPQKISQLESGKAKLNPEEAVVFAHIFDKPVERYLPDNLLGEQITDVEDSRVSSNCDSSLKDFLFDRVSGMPDSTVRSCLLLRLGGASMDEIGNVLGTDRRGVGVYLSRWRSSARGRELQSEVSKRFGYTF